jgi:hypothetical protein
VATDVIAKMKFKTCWLPVRIPRLELVPNQVKALALNFHILRRFG